MYDIILFLSYYRNAIILRASIFTLNDTATDDHNCIKRPLYLNHKFK